MLFAEILCSWVFTTTALTAALKAPSLPHTLPAAVERLDRLDSLTKTLAAENQGLKAQLGDLQRQLVSMDRKQQSLQDQVTRCEGKAGPALAEEEGGRGEEDHQHAAGEQSGPAPHVSEHQGGSRQVKGPSPQHLGDSDPARHLGNPEPSKQHVQSVRSDDQSPLQTVVDHLAQQTTQLTADLRALSTQHSAEIQALSAQHSADLRALSTQHSGDVKALQSADAQQRQDAQAARDARGSTFVRWGSSTCAVSSELVYSGIVGGSWSKHTGAAVNALCMSLSPRPGNKTPRDYALLYSGEYETEDSHDDLDPVCAVCRSPHSTNVMVPGTTVCSAGWTLQYSGLIMAGYHAQVAASEFICVDSKLESVLGSNSNHDGYVLYYTKTRCGGLPCPPYENDKAVTCAVCSK